MPIVLDRSLRRLAIGAAVLGVLALAPAPAPAQDLRSLADQLERLRRDVDVLQRQLARGGGAPGAGISAAPLPGGASAPPSSFIEQTDARLSDFDRQLRDLTGRVEELSFTVSQMSTRLDKLVSDVDFRLSALERGGTPGPAAVAPGSGTVAAAGPRPGPATSTAPGPEAAQVAPGQPRLVLRPGLQAAAEAGGASAGAPAPPTPAPAATGQTQTAAVTLPQGSPEAQYEFAYAQLLQAQREQGDFGRAEAALRAFIAANSNHRLAGNAQYWLGETHYVRRDYQNAAVAFAEGFQKYPNSEKAPDNLLKLGMSLGQLNQKPKACGTLGELDRRYPQASASIKQATQREKQRLGCT